MKPFIHAQNSVKRHGGSIEDYVEIHNWFDSTKSADADFYHRAILHNSFGIFLCEQVFGVIITNSDGRQVSVRDIAEDHVIEDCGFIPTIQDWLSELKPKSWMVGRAQRSGFEKLSKKYSERKSID